MCRIGAQCASTPMYCTSRMLGTSLGDSFALTFTLCPYHLNHLGDHCSPKNDHRLAARSADLPLPCSEGTAPAAIKGWLGLLSTSTVGRSLSSAPLSSCQASQNRRHGTGFVGSAGGYGHVVDEMRCQELPQQTPPLAPATPPPPSGDDVTQWDLRENIFPPRREQLPGRKSENGWRGEGCSMDFCWKPPRKNLVASYKRTTRGNTTKRINSSRSQSLFMPRKTNEST